MKTTKEQVSDAFRAVILAEREARGNKWSWAAHHPDPDTPEGIEFERVSSALCKAQSKMWDQTDFEYDNDGFRNVVWTWRYWKVMARKCCWYQKTMLSTWRAGWTMRQLQQAEDDLVQVCGLQDIYKSGCEYIEEQFPNLKRL